MFKFSTSSLKPPTFLVVGLGNPGKEYDFTRHNAGAMALDKLARRYKAESWKKKFKGQTASSAEPPLLFLKPETYMNLSGEAVSEALRFHKFEPAQVIVFHDDLDIAPGQVKVKIGGGSGGHNGLKSIDQHIGQSYWRVRIGIGHPRDTKNPGEDVSDYVLNSFAKTDKIWLDPLLDALASEFPAMLENKPNDYQSRIARKTNSLPEQE